MQQLGNTRMRQNSALTSMTDINNGNGDNTFPIITTSAEEEVVIKTKHSVKNYNQIVKEKVELQNISKEWEKAKPCMKTPAADLIEQQGTMVFCVPPNYDLLKYWDRVEDRLFKIHNCMNISGVRRQLALFQPPINPMLLVRARAAGLSLEDILGGPPFLPPYRFNYLIEKAKQFTQTVQSFGSTLLSALEKKDVEELTLLRSVHERNILQMTKEIKKQAVKEAQYQYLSISATKTNVQNRANYYQGLIDGGLTGWEITQQVSKHIATGFKIAEGGLHLLAGIYYLIPNAGSPFAMTYGGKQLGTSGAEFAQWTSSMAAVAEGISASASLEATFQRREQEWNNQLLLANQELVQVEQQRLAAEVRAAIAEKDLEIHDKNVEQADELHEFYKNKFTRLGLYNYLSTTLNRLYREAYNIAYDLARMAEDAYRFERDDEKAFFIAGDNWQFDQAGLLAGERLLLQLQRLEKAYLEQDTRDYEITQSFSLALLNPSALINLRQEGRCEFSIPELVFDLLYPGQYKRLIKSTRITVPCVAGPYTNISAKLSLTASKVRRVADVNADLDLILNKNQNTSIATSNAQNDSGMFELNFRDERYLPFEGAGAVESSWFLELPSKIRSFDYETISDVIIHVSYAAKDGGTVFREDVENKTVEKLSVAASNGLVRLISLKHEFPNALYKILHPSEMTMQTAEFELGKNRFPYFLTDRSLTISSTEVYLRSKGKDHINTVGLKLKINNTDVGSWSDFGTNMNKSDVSLSGDPIGKWIIDAGTSGTGVLDSKNLDDILILLKYRTS